MSLQNLKECYEALIISACQTILNWMCPIEGQIECETVEFYPIGDSLDYLKFMVLRDSIYILDYF